GVARFHERLQGHARLSETKKAPGGGALRTDAIVLIPKPAASPGGLSAPRETPLPRAYDESADAPAPGPTASPGRTAIVAGRLKTGRAPGPGFAALHNGRANAPS